MEITTDDPRRRSYFDDVLSAYPIMLLAETKSSSTPISAGIHPLPSDTEEAHRMPTKT